MLFDCEEYYMKTRLVKRGKESGRVDDNLTAIGNRIKFYKYNTIPLMKTLDDQKKLVAVSIAEMHQKACFTYLQALYLHIQSTLDISNSDISNSAKLEASTRIKNTF